MLNRRDFIKGIALSAAAGSNTSFCPGARAEGVSFPAESRNRTPYQNIDWEHSFQIHTTTHGHITHQKVLERFLNRGFEFLTISNYYPSAPYYPLEKMTINYYRVHHDHPVMVNGKMMPGPFNWNEIIKPWIGELDEKYRKAFPFREGGKLFTDYPKNILQAPNAEHHSFTDSPTHICAPGSNYASGTFDARNKYETKSRGGYNFGTGLPWKKAVDRMFDGLIFPDGGGITINHPVWTRLKKDHMLDILDYDSRVLGIEVFNMSAGNLKSYPWSDKFNENYWDFALSTGRQCFGFFVPDWGVEEGVNILLVPERSAHECLRAYRQGNWYGAIKGRGILNFKRINFDGKKLRAQTDKKARFQIIARSGSIFEKTDDHFEFDVAADRRADYGYLRIKAFALDNSGEILFSQPFML
ncbi:MAG: hypothetical protein Q4G69_04745 [Planctomycetia bacterium]|nr:hypothetical protein [Planctomycetia bacterium]